MMRNALGREEGGSGVAKYMESVKFWMEHIAIKYTIEHTASLHYLFTIA
jgi:Protein of unknown function (DUF3228)